MVVGGCCGESQRISYSFGYLCTPSLTRYPFSSGSMSAIEISQQPTLGKPCQCDTIAVLNHRLAAMYLRLSRVQ